MFPLQMSREKLIYEGVVIGGWRKSIYRGCVDAQKYTGSLCKRNLFVDMDVIT